MTLKNNRAPLLSNIKLSASFHHHMWIQTGVTVRKRLSWVLTSVTLTFDLWPWPFAWTLLWSLVITPENFMMIRWWKHGEKGGTDGQTDGQTDNTICRAAWSQLKTYRLKTFADLRRRWRSCVTRIGHTAAADVPVDSCIQLSHLYASVPPVSFWCSWISWSSRNFRQRSWLHCGSYCKCIHWGKVDTFMVSYYIYGRHTRSWWAVVFRGAPVDFPGSRLIVAACLRWMRLTFFRPHQPQQLCRLDACPHGTAQRFYALCQSV